ncbi:MAG: hypothetical protein AAF927_06505 [Bacteroidota bacterium]
MKKQLALTSLLLAISLMGLQAQATSNPDSTGIFQSTRSGELELDSAVLDVFQEKALKMTAELERYVITISQSNTAYERALNTIDLACLLFIDEESVVEVSSVNRESVINYAIREYLEHLMEMKYDKVEISWANIKYISKLRLGADGNYYGTISIEQKFVGYLGEKAVYEDTTIKNIEIVLKTYEKIIAGKAVKQWDVLLGDIGVQETF